MAAMSPIRAILATVCLERPATIMVMTVPTIVGTIDMKATIHQLIPMNAVMRHTTQGWYPTPVAIKYRPRLTTRAAPGIAVRRAGGVAHRAPVVGWISWR